jgi:DNA-binding transcriptional LysR family regulator
MQGELNQIANLALFAKIVQTGGISRCAADLGMERTTVSRRLGDLERMLGVKLLDRSPQNTAVTEAGRLCFERCELLLEVAKDAQSVATNGKVVVRAEPILVGAPPDIIEHYLGSKLTEFEVANPNATVMCHPISNWTEATASTADMTIGWERPTNSESVARKLTGVEQSVYASPEYLAKHGSPKNPQDIKNHSCIVDGPPRKNVVWKFESESESGGVLIKRRIEVSGLLEARASTLAGLGLCRLPNYLCEREKKEGRLVALLSEYKTPTRALLLICPRAGAAKPRATMLRLFLETAFEANSM